MDPLGTRYIFEPGRSGRRANDVIFGGLIRGVPYQKWPLSTPWSKLRKHVGPYPQGNDRGLRVLWIPWGHGGFLNLEGPARGVQRSFLGVTQFWTPWPNFGPPKNVTGTPHPGPSMFKNKPCPLGFHRPHRYLGNPRAHWYFSFLSLEKVRSQGQN